MALRRKKATAVEIGNILIFGDVKVRAPSGSASVAAGVAHPCVCLGPQCRVEASTASSGALATIGKSDCRAVLLG